MTEPQLSAEMEKRFSKIMLEWIESQWKIEQAHQNGEPYTRMKFEAYANEVENKLKHFLATALEEERAKVLSEVEEAIDEAQNDYSYEGMGCYLEDRNITDRYQAMEYGFNKAIDMVRERLPAKLNQLKGSDDTSQS